ncbi:hypothetical protein VE03_02747 [Pseudogymnoascus sp. 23342-1-I1]|nr:hypothetical protein VE03_02747 [Pseudogymnoascus sp. 23342-1-I1]
MATPSPTPRIHILGLGNLAKLFAHSLSTLPSPPPLTLLTHRPSLPPSSPITLTLTRHSVPLPSPPLELSLITPSGPEITHLILTTKSPSTAAAIKPLLPRLSAESTILFTQNGIGAIEEVSALFPPSAQPTYLSAIVTHGVFSTGPLSATHAGIADLKIGPVSSPPPTIGISASSRWLMDTILSSEALAATEVHPTELLKATLEKLVANAVINPLTAIFRVPNASVLHPSLTPLRQALVEETSAVVLAHLTSTLGALDAETAERFSVERLGRMVERVCRVTGANRSSMLQDVEAGRGTEVGFINGWVVRRGGEMGVGVGVSGGVVGMVEGGVVGKIEGAGEVFRGLEGCKG